MHGHTARGNDGICFHRSLVRGPFPPHPSIRQGFKKEDAEFGIKVASLWGGEAGEPVVDGRNPEAFLSPCPQGPRTSNP